MRFSATVARSVGWQNNPIAQRVVAAFTPHGIFVPVNHSTRQPWSLCVRETELTRDGSPRQPAAGCRGIYRPESRSTKPIWLRGT